MERIEGRRNVMLAVLETVVKGAPKGEQAAEQAFCIPSRQELTIGNSDAPSMESPPLLKTSSWW